VAPAPGLVVTRDGQPATVGDLRTGDAVTVAQAPDGTPRRIDATSQPTASNAGSNDWVKWLPFLLVPLLLAALWAITRRRPDAFVLERVPARVAQLHRAHV